MNRNQEVMKHFSGQDSWEQRYKKIISLGQALPAFKEEEKKPERLIKACQSRLWLKAELNDKEELVLTGDSEGLITKGLLAIMIIFYSHQKVEEVLKAQPLFLEELELNSYLSFKRTNGLQALIEQIRNYAKAFSLLATQK